MRPKNGVIAIAAVNDDSRRQHIASVNHVVTSAAVDVLQIEICEVDIYCVGGHRNVERVNTIAAVQVSWIAFNKVAGDRIANQPNVDAQLEVRDIIVSIPSGELIGAAATVECIVASASNQRVVTGLPLQIVIAIATGNTIVSAPSGDCVVAALTKEDVVAFAAVGAAEVINVATDIVVSGSATNRIVAFTADQQVIQAGSSDVVVAFTTKNLRCRGLVREINHVIIDRCAYAFDLVVKRGPGDINGIMSSIKLQRVNSSAKVVGDRVAIIRIEVGQKVIAGSTGDCVGSSTRVNRAAAITCDQRVITIVSRERVRASATDQRIVALLAGEPVIAIAPHNHIIAIATLQIVVSGIAADRVVANVANQRIVAIATTQVTVA